MARTRHVQLSVILSAMLAALSSCSGDSGTVPTRDCLDRTVGTVTAGQTRSGALSGSSCVMDDARYIDRWVLRVPEAAWLRVDLTSNAFDAFLILEDTEGRRLAWDDDGGVGLNSRLIYDFAPGEYRLLATTYGEREEGRYEIAVGEVTFCTPGSVVETVGPGQTLSGTVGTDDCQFLHGEPARGYRLELEEPTGIQMDLSVSGGEGLLVVTNDQLEPLWWDRDWDGESARIERRLPAREFHLWVGVTGGGSGAFTLSVHEVTVPLCPVVGELAFDETRPGTLGPTTCLHDGRRHGDPWTLVADAPTTLQIDAMSPYFDTYLVLEDEDGTWIAHDDDGGVEFNSRLVYDFAPGEYRVMITSFSPGETGPYQLRVQEVGAAAAESTGPEGGRVRPGEKLRQEGPQAAKPREGVLP